MRGLLLILFLFSSVLAGAAQKEFLDCSQIRLGHPAKACPRKLADGKDGTAACIEHKNSCVVGVCERKKKEYTANRDKVNRLCSNTANASSGECRTQASTCKHISNLAPLRDECTTDKPTKRQCSSIMDRFRRGVGGKTCVALYKSGKDALEEETLDFYETTKSLTEEKAQLEQQLNDVIDQNSVSDSDRNQTLKEVTDSLATAEKDLEETKKTIRADVKAEIQSAIDESQAAMGEISGLQTKMAERENEYQNAVRAQANGCYSEANKVFADLQLGRNTLISQKNLKAPSLAKLADAKKNFNGLLDQMYQECVNSTFYKESLQALEAQRNIDMQAFNNIMGMLNTRLQQTTERAKQAIAQAKLDEESAMGRVKNSLLTGTMQMGMLTYEQANSKRTGEERRASLAKQLEEKNKEIENNVNLRKAFACAADCVSHEQIDETSGVATDASDIISATDARDAACTEIKESCREWTTLNDQDLKATQKRRFQRFREGLACSAEGAVRNRTNQPQTYQRSGQ